MAYEIDKDKEHWRKDMEDGDVVVRIMQYDEGQLKVAINRWEEDNNRWLRLGRFTAEESTFLACALSEASEYIKQLRLNAFSDDQDSNETAEKD